MKKLIALLFCLMAVMVLQSCSNSSSSDDTPPNEGFSTTTPSSSTPVTASSRTYPAATATEMAVITEMNYARTHPQDYVQTRLIPRQTPPYFNNSTTYLATLNECITQMNAMTPVGALQFSQGLYESAVDWVETQGPTGDTGHDPNIASRTQAHTSYTILGENLAYGCNTAEEIVADLLVDDGVSGRGHRENILRPQFTHAGASIGSHNSIYNIMCCIDYGTGVSR